MMMMISTFCNLATFKAAIGDVGAAQTRDRHQLVRQHHDDDEADVGGDDDDEEDGHQYHDNEEDGH